MELVLCITTRLRLMSILTSLVKYLVIFHADPCNKSYISACTGISISMVLISEGLASLAQLFYLTFILIFIYFNSPLDKEVKYIKRKERKNNERVR